jgi:glucosamine-6-phosphate deaminase
MKLIEVKDYNDMSQKAAQMIIEKIRQNPSMNLGLATGGTPVGTYQSLIKDHQQYGTSYQNITTFNLDEYIGLTGDNPNSYRYFMNDKLFDHIDIDKNNTHIPNGNVNDMAAECARYENLIADHGGIDLQILGIGGNGHIGFNEPGTSFDSTTHIVQLAASTIEANARFFEQIEDVPTQAITMGIASIMRSKEILLLISGENKRAALDQLLNGDITEQFPASVLKKHPNVTIIADKAALFV